MKHDHIKILIGCILHAYQPPNQDPKILNRIVNNCYFPIIKALENNPDLKINLNINGSLSELLIKFEYGELIDRIKGLVRNDQIEFLESAAYHPILPLLSINEVLIQIELNRKINTEIFGASWSPLGVWPPELAVSEALISLIATLNYEYIVVPQLALNSDSFYCTPLITKIPIHPSAPNLALIYRNKEISNNISFKRYLNIQDIYEHILHMQSFQPEGVLIVATDIETFGEHHRNYENFLVQFLKKHNSIKISQILEIPRVSISQFRDSSWSTSEEDLQNDIPYPLWADPGNSIHEILNLHNDLVSKALDQLLSYKKNSNSLIDSAVIAAAKSKYSCQAWWASSRDHFSKILIRKGFESQKIALNKIIKAIKFDKKDSHLIQEMSKRLEERLEYHLSRIK